jgi:integrase
VGNDATYAVTAKLKREKAIDAANFGVALQDEPRHQNRVKISDAVTEYLNDRQIQKARKTYAGGKLVLDGFTQSCGKTYLDQIDRRDLLDYVNFCKKHGLADRTVFNRIESLCGFLRAYGITGLLARRDWPKYTEKIVDAYDEQELKQLFAAADAEDRLAFQFFLGSGAREQEMMFAAWRDLDFTSKTFHITEKPELGFKPKDHEERVVPLSDKLVAALQARHRQHRETRLIFSNGVGRPEGHFLRRLKTLALRAGLNCGHCVNRRGLSCKEHPVCSRWELHKFRKTFATMHHESGVSARTLQAWLGHSDLETTLAYLKVADMRSERTREQVNGSFAALG